MDIMDGMDTMDFSFDGRNGQVQGHHLLYVSIYVHDVHCVHRVPVH
jgi:hypothetical protein